MLQNNWDLQQRSVCRFEICLWSSCSWWAIIYPENTGGTKKVGPGFECSYLRAIFDFVISWLCDFDYSLSLGPPISSKRNENTNLISGTSEVFGQKSSTNEHYYCQQHCSTTSMVIQNQNQQKSYLTATCKSRLWHRSPLYVLKSCRISRWASSIIIIPQAQFSSPFN